MIQKLLLNTHKFVSDDWLKLLDECLSYDVVSIRTVAINAIPAFFNEYYVGDSADQLNKCGIIIKDYMHELESITYQVTRMGHALALGTLPEFMLIPQLDDIIFALIQSMEINKHTLKWAECRRDAIKALTNICVTLESKNEKGIFILC